MTHDEFKEASKLYSAVQASLHQIANLEGYRGKTKHVVIRFEGAPRNYENRALIFSTEVKGADAGRLADAELDRIIASWRLKMAAACRRLAQLGCAPPPGVTS